MTLAPHVHTPPAPHEHSWKVALWSDKPASCHRMERDYCTIRNCGSFRVRFPETGEYIQEVMVWTGDDEHYVFSASISQHWSALAQEAAMAAQAAAFQPGGDDAPRRSVLN